MDEDGFDYMKIAFLRDIKAQQRSLRCVYNCLFISVHQIAIFLHMADPG